MNGFFDLVYRVQQSDMEREENKLKVEADKRRLLRLQNSDQGVSMSELLKQLSNEGGDQAPAISLASSPEVRSDAPINTRPQFPPPPRSAPEKP